MQERFEDKHLQCRWKDSPEAGTTAWHPVPAGGEASGGGSWLSVQGVSIDPELRHTDVAAPLPRAVSNALDIQTLTWMPRHSQAWPISLESKDFLFKPSFRKGNHFSISSSQGDPTFYFALRVRSWGLLLIQFYFSLLSAFYQTP